MARNLDILDDQLELGQTKIISRDGGRIVDFVELLLSTSTKGQFAPSTDKKMVELCIKDTDLSLPQLECSMTKASLKDLIVGLKAIYGQLESEVAE